MEEKNRDLNRISNIEIAIMGGWVRDDNNLQLFFFPSDGFGGLGECDIMSVTPQGLGFGKFKYNVFIRDNNPFVNFIQEDEDNETQIKEYEILEIDTTKKVFRLKNSLTHQQLNFRQQILKPPFPF